MLTLQRAWVPRAWVQSLVGEIPHVEQCSQKKKKKKSYGTSLAVPGQGTKMPHATWPGQKKNDRKEYKTLTIADTTVLTISQVLLHTL